MKTVKVLVVDDSAFSRRSISTMLEGMQGVRVVGYAVDGEEGIRQTISLKPDLVTLDLEMPRMDGFTLLRILTSRFNMPVIVVSALSKADKVFKALELGAVDFVAKPSAEASPDLMLISNDLQYKVRQAVKARVKGFATENIPQSHRAPNLPTAGLFPAKRELQLVAIAASTGGPPALQSIFASFDQPLPFGIVVAQHMPPGFTAAFSERLNKATGFEVKEAAEGDVVKPGIALVAPGGKNMVLEESAGTISVKLLPPPPDKRYIPSADELICSCSAIYGSRMMAVVLTGMGNDGAAGVKAVKSAGGMVIAESERSSVVYGMPREAYATGCVDMVADLVDIPDEIIRCSGLKKSALKQQ